jgi:4-coumarate--CoA ligase
MLIRSPLVTNGYFNNPTATQDAFVTLPDDPSGDKWFCSGDIGVYRNGKWYIVDRKKEILKYKGQQVAPAEIENLLFTHPKIQEAAVVGLSGQGPEKDSELPRAYVVKKTEMGDITENEVKEFVKSRLAPYKQLRGGVVFVDELPKNAIGKYLRRELRERAKKEVGAGKEARL